MMTNMLAEGTGKWIFERPQYKEWLEMKLGKPGLWITGDPGCGKSYIAKNVVDKLREKDEAVICVFLREPGPTNIDLWHLMSETLRQALEIEPRLPLQQRIQRLLINARDQVLAAGSQWNGESYPTESNLHGLLASSIRQALVEITPESIDKHLLPILRSGNPPRSLELDYLQELWPKIMEEALKTMEEAQKIMDKAQNITAEAPRKRPIITTVIDGFDKMGRQDQKTFLTILTKFQKQPSMPGIFRLLVISNDYPELNLDIEEHEFIRYPIDKAKDIGSDIKASVTQRMDILKRIHRYPPEIQKEIEEGVPKAADGMYLQADLMLGSLKRTKYDKGALNELLETPLHRTPIQSTVVLYDQILGNILTDTSMRRSVKHVLTWVTFQLEGLNPAELGIARALAKARDNPSGIANYDEVCDLRDDDTELWVNRFLGHLVKLRNNQFELIHPSLMKYLVTQPEQLEEIYGDNVLPYHAESYMDPAASHALLGNLCATYLARSCFDQSVRDRPECRTWFAWQAAVKERMKEHKFFRYAALHWSEHLSLARDLAVPGSNSRRMMAADRKRHEKLVTYTNSWMDVRCYFHDWHKDDYSSLCSAEENILHRPYEPKQSAAADDGQASSTQPDQTGSGVSGTTQSSPPIEQTTPLIEQSIPETGQRSPEKRATEREELSTLVTEPPTPLTELPNPLIELPSIPRAEVPNLPTELPTLRTEPSTPLTNPSIPPTVITLVTGGTKQEQQKFHWLVKGAQKVVDILELEKPKQPQRPQSSRSKSSWRNRNQ